MIRAGYQSPDYAESFREFFEVITLPQSGLRLLRRPIDGDRFDVAGPYPFAACNDWSRVSDDLPYLRNLGAVSIVFVVDPFQAEAARPSLSSWSLCREYKTQFLVDLKQDWRARRAKNTRCFTRKALRQQDVTVSSASSRCAPLFYRLYQSTVLRHDIRDVRRMSPSVIEAQMKLPGALLSLATQDAGPCGAMLSFNEGRVAHFHLLGLLPLGHRIGSSYALLFQTLETLESTRCELVNLGGPAGLVDDPADSLFQFKRHWAQERKRSLLCGEILDESAYWQLCESRKPDGSFFPAYRAPAARTSDNR